MNPYTASWHTPKDIKIRYNRDIRCPYIGDSLILGLGAVDGQVGQANAL